MKDKKQKILGIDPGFAIVGYGVVSDEGNALQPGSYGVITTSAKLELLERLQLIHWELDKIITQTKPDVIAVEKVFFSKNVKTAMDVGQARGVILLTAVQHKIPVVEFTPNEIKQAIAAYGSAGKAQIQQMVKVLLGLHEIPKPDDAADALAVAITALQTKRFV